MSNATELATAKASGKLVVIDWTASWCGPCQKIAPILEELSVQHPKVVFLKVDVDQHGPAALEAGISAMPTFQFFKGEDKVVEFAGADAERLKESLRTHDV